MATTTETAIVWTVILMAISGVTTMVNFMGPSGTTFVQVDNSFLQSLVVTPDDVNSLILQYQNPESKESDSVPVNTFVFINQALETGAFTFKAALNIAFGWVGLVYFGITAAGIPPDFALLIAFTITSPLLLLQMYGLLQLAFLTKRLIPFLG